MRKNLMTKTSFITVATPCSESWSSMKPTNTGRFCGQCSKTVVNYASMTDQELIQVLREPLSSGCGRFRAGQLNRPLRQETNGSLSYRRLVGLVTAGLLGWQTTQAQLPASKANRVIVLDGTAEKRPGANASTAAPVDSSRIITGRVIAEFDGSALAGVTIQIKGTGRSTQTDSTGSFRVTAPTGVADNEVTLAVSWIGFVYQEVWIKPDQQNPLLIRLKEDTAALNEVIVIGYPVIKPTFWQRLRNRLRPNR